MKTKATKGGRAKPSSSSGASSLLSIPGFVGFSEVVGPASFEQQQNGGGSLAAATVIEGPHVAVSPFYTGDDSELRVICKRLSKKDSITKLKALSELAQLFGDRGEAVVESFVPFWLHIYSRLVVAEEDRRVREAVFATVMQQLFAASRRTMLSILGRYLLGPWCCAMSDPFKEVAQAAARALEYVFPKLKRREEMMSQAAPLVLSYLNENLAQTPDSLTDVSQATPEEVEDRYERVMLSTLMALTALVEGLDETSIARLSTRTSILSAEGSTEQLGSLGGGPFSSFEELLHTSNNLWKRVQDSRPTLRRASYRLLAAVSGKLAPLIRQTGQVASMAQLASTILTEKDPNNHGPMWEAVLVFFHSFPKALTSGVVDCRTQLFPRFLKLLKAKFYGSANASCPSILPLVALIPSGAACTGIDEGKGQSGAGSFYGDVLDLLWKGAKDGDGGGAPYYVAIVEVVTYLLVKPDPPPQGLAAQMLQNLLLVLAAALAGDSGGQETQDALATALAQMERVGRDGKRECLLQCVEAELWKAIKRLACKALNHGENEQDAEASEATIAALTSMDKAGLPASGLSTRSHVLSSILCGAYDKVQGVAKASWRATGLASILIDVFWGCLEFCISEALREREAPPSHLLFVKAVAQRIDYNRIRGDGTTHPAAAELITTAVMPLLRTSCNAASTQSAITVVGELLLLLSVQTDSDSQVSVWEGTVQIATATRLSSLVYLLRAVVAAHGSLVHPGVGKALLSAAVERRVSHLQPLLSDALGRLVVAIASSTTYATSPDAPAAEHLYNAPIEDRRQLLMLALGVGCEGLEEPLVSQEVVRRLVELALEARGPLLLEVLVVALRHGHGATQAKVELEPLWSRLASVLWAAVVVLGPSADSSIHDIVEANGHDVRESLADKGIDELKMGLETTEQWSAAAWAEVASRLASVLETSSTSYARVVAALMMQVGLLDAEEWRACRRNEQQKERWQYRWCVTLALLESVSPQERLACLYPCGNGGEEEHGLNDIDVVLELLQTGVELGYLDDGGSYETSRLSRFLTAYVTVEPSSRLPSDQAVTLLFGRQPQGKTALNLLVRVVKVLLDYRLEEGQLRDWGSAFLLAELLSVFERGVEVETQGGPVNDAVLGPVVMPRQQMGEFMSADEIVKGTEVWYFDKNDTSEPWKKGVVVAVHKDDLEKYFTVAKATGGETQFEVSRLRRSKPFDITRLAEAVCQGASRWLYSHAPAATVRTDQATSEHADALLPALVETEAWLHGHTDAAGCSFSVAELVRTIRAVELMLSEQAHQEFEAWQGQVRARWSDDITQAAGAVGQDHAASYSKLASALHVLSSLACDASSADLLGALEDQGIMARADGDAALLRSAYCNWLCASRPGFPDRAQGVLEELWGQQARAGVEVSGAALALVEAAVDTRFGVGGGHNPSLGPTTTAAMFRLGMIGFTNHAHSMGGTNAKDLARRELCNRCRLLAVTLIPADNQGLEWTTHIYADPNAQGLSLNKTLWDEDIELLLKVLDAPVVPTVYRISALHVLRPFLRSNVHSTETDDDGKEDDDAFVDAQAGEAVVFGGPFDEFVGGPRGLPQDERREVLADLRAVETRLPQGLHDRLMRLVGCWGPSGGGDQRRLHMEHMCQEEGLLEALGQQDEDIDPEHRAAIAEYRVVMLRALLAWLLFLEHVDSIALSSKLRGAYSTYVSLSRIVPTLLQACFRVLHGRATLPELHDLWLMSSPCSARDIQQLAAYVAFRTIVGFPAIVRKWWASSECERWLSTAISRFVAESASQRVMQREIDLIVDKKGEWGAGEDEISVRGSSITREVTAHYVKEDCTLDVVIRLPASYPLRNVEVECTRSLGISGDKWKKWQLQIVTLLSTRDGSVVDAVSMWIRNLQKEFEGLEACPICYSILHPKNFSLPSKECRTCHNRFHSACILKWFQTSGKRQCPLCRSENDLLDTSGARRASTASNRGS